MGVSLETYRCHIGLFCLRFRASSKTSFSCAQPVGVSLRHVAVVILLALLVSGIEPNPGPVFPCKSCTLMCQSIGDYCMHVRLHESSQKKNPLSIPCCWCQQQLKNEDSLDSHISRFHREKRDKYSDKPTTSHQASSAVASTSRAVTCPVCLFKITARDIYLEHMSVHLKDNETFQCPLRSCGTMCVELSKFRSHTSRYHPSRAGDFETVSKTTQHNVQSAGSGETPHSLDTFEDAVASENSDTGEDEMEGNSGFAENLYAAFDEKSDLYPEYQIKEELAKYYLKLEAVFLLHTEQVDAIAKQNKFISELSHHKLQQSLKRELDEAGIKGDVVESAVKRAFKGDPVFNIHHKNEDVEHLVTNHLRNKFWHQRFPFVEPKEIYLGTDDSGKKRRAHHVSIRETLTILLRDENVKKHVRRSFTRESEVDVYQDYCDGSLHKEHMKQHSNGKCMQLLLFQDAFDLNAFGVAQGQFKPVGYYYILGNLPPEYRSKVDLIQLVYLILEKDLKTSQHEELCDEDKLKFALKIVLDELEELKINGIEFDGEMISVCVLLAER